MDVTIALPWMATAKASPPVLCRSPLALLASMTKLVGWRVIAVESPTPCTRHCDATLSVS